MACDNRRATNDSDMSTFKAGVMTNLLSLTLTRNAAPWRARASVLGFTYYPESRLAQPCSAPAAGADPSSCDLCSHELSQMQIDLQ